MNAGGTHPSVTALRGLGRPLTDDVPDLWALATPLLDDLPSELNLDEIAALIDMLPASGDTAAGLNWTILHAIEASPHWPQWDLIADPNHEWHDILRLRLKNGGYAPPTSNLMSKFFKR